MKILELTFENLNSLYGKWKIDFKNNEYQSNGIFAITGPTGSGKSTILDALTLALYGSTPRLGRITQGSSEIMSRGSGECSSELMFESSGRIYLCSWSQHRSRKKPDGDLQAPRHEISISDNSGYTIIESTLTGTIKAVEEITGMNFKRFTRSVMLAQGSFDIFLKADAKDKSAVLEQITGTEIYSEISRKVHERKTAEAGKLDELKSSTGSITLLPQEELDLKISSLESLEKNLIETEKKIKETETLIGAIEKKEKLGKEITQTEEEVEQIISEIKNFKPQQEKLRRAEAAGSISIPYTKFSTAENRIQEDRKRLEKLNLLIPALSEKKEEKQNSLKEAEKILKETDLRHKKELEIIRQAEILDLEITAGNSRIKDISAEISELDNKIASQNNIISRALDSVKKNKEKLEQAAAFLEGALQENLSGLVFSEIKDLLEKIERESSRYSELKEEQEKYREEISRIKYQITRLEQESNSVKDKLETAENKKENLEKKLNILLEGRTVKQLRLEKEHLIAEQPRYKMLEELKHSLKNGEPCPLCGSTEHPGIEHADNQSIENKTDNFIQSIADKIEEAEKTEKEVEEINLEIIELENTLERKNLSAEHLEKEQASQKEQLLSVERKLEENRKTILLFINNFIKSAESLHAHKIKELLPLSEYTAQLETAAALHNETQGANLLFELPLPEETEKVFECVNAYTDKLKEYSEEKVRIQELITEEEGTVKTHSAVRKTLEEQKEKEESGLSAAKKKLDNLNSKRISIFGVKDTAAEKKRIETEAQQAAENEKEKRSAYNTAETDYISSLREKDALNEELEVRKKELDTLKEQFIKALKDAGFKTAEDFLNARMDSTGIDEIRKKEKFLESRKTELETTLKEKKKLLEQETQILSMLPPESTIITLTETLNALEEEKEKLTEEISELKIQIAENERLKKILKEKLDKIEKQKNEYRKWAALHNLIGSADGKKYRNIAQGITFDILLANANRKLIKLTDRYLLVRPQEASLELSVADNWQGGEIRPVSNLSGGESFIVSLALALGLSSISGGKVKVDSLFLDEGFGTLDEDSLDSALQALSSLQHEGKIIGVISHVTALKERISTQISIVPLSGGKSVIEGPGCSRG